VPSPAAPAAQLPPQPASAAAGEPALQGESPLAATTAAPPGAAAAGEVEVTATLTPDYTSRPQPGWLETIDPVPAAPSASGSPPLPEPLLVPRWTRAILGGALASLAAHGPLDQERLASQVARGLPVKRLPRRPWPTLARGVQLLVDRSDRMLPFNADQVRFVEQVRAVAGREQVEVLSFDGLPEWGAGPGARRLWQPYQERHLPRRGATVVVLSDLGLGTFPSGGRAAGSGEWLRFAAAVRRAGCPLIVFVPYGEARWPAKLRDGLHLLHWDRTTSVRSVRRVLGKAMRVPGEESG
jgi:hypothetical protein